MKAKVDGSEKSPRILGGSFLLSLMLVGAIGSWDLIGRVPLAIGLFERCDLYSIIGIFIFKLNG